MTDKPQISKSAPLPPFSNGRASHCGPNIDIIVDLKKNRNDIVAKFSLRGDTAAIRWPASLAATGQGTSLWKHTCFELFISPGDNPNYWEYNFSPSRQWAIYAFEDYRKPMPITVSQPPQIISPRLTHNTFSLQAGFTLASELVDKPISVGACAVIETIDGQYYYYALSHCSDKPDFHRRESFLIKMN